AIQQAMGARNAELAEDARIVYRIGINIGDVIVEGDDIYGDGVNIAARLESIAEPGGICVSGAVHEQVRGKLDLGFEDMGARALKNIERAVHAYRVVPEAAAAAPAPKVPDKPSVAVLPFENLSGQPEHAALADGLADEVITALSKISGLFVIARHSSFAFKGQAMDVREIARRLGVRYVLDGSVRGHGERLRVIAQLIEAATGNHAWAERYDRVIGDIFDLQDELTREIVTALRIELTDGENAEVWKRGTESIEAWRHATEAVEALFKYSAPSNAEARALALSACRADPDYALAWAILGFSHWYEARLAPTGDTDAAMAEAEDCARRADRLDAANSWTTGLRACVLVYRKRYEAAVAAARAGVAHNPGSADARAYLGYALMSAGRPEEAMRYYREAIRLNPLHPIWYLPAMARALDALGEGDAALQTAEAALARDPDNFPSRLHSATLLARLGRGEAAGKAVAEVLRLVPYFDLGRARDWLVSQDEAFVSEYIEGLRLAGLPE
ncbi:MAG: tetratricopeptide repeat protein, partial [Proteobacteria bacterium]|nr:tetratricopeptide repeat protein [Pseudomonadota bacterium]